MNTRREIHLVYTQSPGRPEELLQVYAPAGRPVRLDRTSPGRVTAEVHDPETGRRWWTETREVF